MKRKKELGELNNPYKMKRRIGHVKCSQCGTVGHNKRRCNPATQASKQLPVRLVIVSFFFFLYFSLVDNVLLSCDLTFIGERAKCNST